MVLEGVLRKTRESGGVEGEWKSERWGESSGEEERGREE